MIQEAVDLVRQHGGIKAAARASEIPFSTLQYRFSKADTDLKTVQPGSAAKAIGKESHKPEVRGRVGYRPTIDYPLPKRGRIARYILTSAQNNTQVHRGVWDNLLALANYYQADIMVSRFTYDLTAYREGNVKPGSSLKRTRLAGTNHGAEYDEVYYDPALQPYIVDDRVRLAPGLLWCGEMNILPTAVRPLSGFETYTGRESGIFPHVKLAMESIASAKEEPTKFNYTTGTVTVRNYIQKKAGLKAEFHHCYGGLLVEVNSDGDWWVRQLNADSDGTIHDLTLCARDGLVTDDNAVEAITWGDIHQIRIDETIEAANWISDGSMAEVLQPKFQFMHDVLDFRARNHHERNDPHKRFKRHTETEDDVEEETRSAMDWLSLRQNQAVTWNGRVIVVDSNHDNAFRRWLREADYRADPLNAIIFLEAQLAVYKAIAASDDGFHLLNWAYYDYVGLKDHVEFLQEDQSFIICHDKAGGIECGMHGDLGPNGRRGSRNVFAAMGRKANIGHSHSAGITDGVYQTGTSSLLNLEYNRGPSSWSHSHIVAYPNGKRAIITIWNGKWRA